MSSEVALRTSLGLLAGLLMLMMSPSAASADMVDTHDRACARQSAIWEGLFQDPAAARPSCAARPGLFEATVETAAGAGSLHDLAALTLYQDPAANDQTPVTTPRPKAFEYSDAYATRRKIHFIASFATIPLFVTQYVLGDKLYDGSSGSTKSAHSGVAVGIETLFAVNTVTGVWNMWESRKDPNAGKKRFVHGFMMLGADVGFVATGMLAPGDEGGGDRNTHRNVAITSMAVATASYVIMLIGR